MWLRTFEVDLVERGQLQKQKLCGYHLVPQYLHTSVVYICRLFTKAFCVWKSGGYNTKKERKRLKENLK